MTWSIPSTGIGGELADSAVAVKRVAARRRSGAALSRSRILVTAERTRFQGAEHDVVPHRVAVFRKVCGST